MSVYVTAWIAAFTLTLLVEGPAYALAVRPDAAGWKGAAVGLGATCATHPLLWFVWPLVVQDYALYLVSGELLVTTLEAVALVWVLRLSIRRAAFAACVANGLSLAVGLLV